MNKPLSYMLESDLAATKQRGFNIGLHCQTLERADGIIAGSEITTLGLMKALEKRNDIKKVIRYGPGNYRSFDNDNLDILIIEGWDATLPQFIQKARKNYPDIKIFFWNLSFLGSSDFVKLNVDGYFTNSKKVVPILETVAPTEFLMLAADTDEFKPFDPEDRYSHNVTYLGMLHPFKSAAFIERLLYEALDYGLAIYGHGWGQHPVLKRYWKGILPSGDITRLYSSAKVVLGITEDRQRAAGMINNRVFEALSCGACFVSEHYPALEEHFGDAILYSRKKGDTSSHIEKMLGDVTSRKSLGDRGRELILKHHTYNHRVEQMLDFIRCVSSLGF